MVQNKDRNRKGLIANILYSQTEQEVLNSFFLREIRVLHSNKTNGRGNRKKEKTEG